MKNLFFAALFVGALSSCIPNKKVVYLQNKKLDPKLANDTLIPLNRVDYRLQSNDILLINFYSKAKEEVEKYYPLFARPDNILNAAGRGNGQMMGGFGVGPDPYLTGYHVDRDGKIEINTLGRVQASGLTLTELKHAIEDLIKPDIKDILVSVKLNGIRYTIQGEVKQVGSNILRQYEANLLEAIAAAGDLTINADRSHVLILRQYPEGVKIHELDITGRDFIKTDLFFLRPDDLIYVPPLKIRELGSGDSFLKNFASLITIISGTALIISLITRK